MDDIGWPVGYFIALGSAGRWCRSSTAGSFFAGTTGTLLAAHIWFLFLNPPLAPCSRQEAGCFYTHPVAAVDPTDLFKPANIKITSLTTTICLCALMTYWAVNTWLPTLLLQERGLKLKGVILYLVMFNIGNVIGFLFGGRIGDKLGKRNVMVVSGVLSAIMFYVWLGFTTDNHLLVVGSALSRGRSHVLGHVAGIYCRAVPDQHSRLWHVHLLFRGTFCFNIDTDGPGRGGNEVRTFGSYCLYGRILSDRLCRHFYVAG